MIYIVNSNFVARKPRNEPNSLKVNHIYTIERIYKDSDKIHYIFKDTQSGSKIDREFVSSFDADQFIAGISGQMDTLNEQRNTALKALENAQ